MKTNPQCLLFTKNIVRSKIYFFEIGFTYGLKTKEIENRPIFHDFYRSRKSQLQKHATACKMP